MADHHDAGAVRFRVLGPLHVSCGSGEIVVGAGKHRALLATLLLRANQVVPVEDLIAHVWGPAAPPAARSTLQTYVRRLRRTLGACLIATRPDGYLIRLTADQLDLVRFDQLLDQARHAGDPAREAALLGQALALWRGPALADVPSDALRRDEIPRLHERRLQALDRRIDLDLHLGRHAEVVAELRALTAEHPFRERLWAQLMTALYRCGRQAEALAAYQTLRQQLTGELGIDPGPELRELHQAILTDDRALRDRPQRRHPAVPEMPRQLPAGVPGFTGRAEQLARLTRMLGDDEPATVCAITGAPGVGKTALAVHWAHQVAERFPDGQLYVDLHGHATRPATTPEQALAQLLRALGVAPDRVPAGQDERAALYRSRLAGKRMLLVLDDAAGAEQVRPLLPGEKACRVLVTSRNRLRGLTASHGAARLSLDVLDAEESVALLGRLLGSDRVRAEPRAAGELARLCGHLPLALRVAAADLAGHPASTVAEYAAVLRADDRLARLEVDGDRQAAVRAAFDLSYRALAETQRRMFRLLGLVPGTAIAADGAAALAGCDRAEAGRLLAALADAHLVQPHEGGRFCLPDLLRLYAAGRCRAEDAAADRTAALGRLAHFYLDTAARPGTRGGPRGRTGPGRAAPAPCRSPRD